MERCKDVIEVGDYVGHWGSTGWIKVDGEGEGVVWRVRKGFKLGLLEEQRIWKR